ncbi:hypothetical protein [Pseudoalteromonas sp. T1lg10]|nr:hypothetical protein [Pseudoalteromonas sp. T1lg10]
MPRLSTLTLLKVIIVFGVLLIIGGHTLLVTDSFRVILAFTAL